MILQSLMIVTGLLITSYSDYFSRSDYYMNRYNAGDALYVSIPEPVEEKQRFYRVAAKVDFISSDNESQKTNGNILLYFRKDSTGFIPTPGDRFRLKKEPIEIMSTGNPGAFDFREYSRLHGISHQLFLNKNDLVILEREDPPWYSELIFDTRTTVLFILKKYIPGKREAGLAEAMLIGYRGDLDDELLQAYSNTGVVHLIAISGLHLGIIYAILFRACSLLRIKNRYLRSAIIFIALWIFAFIAGASPSVLRSAVMFSFIVFGSSLKRKVPVVNSLAASAFVLLSINPYWLWDIGFQLSYAAVLSIVLLMKPVYNLIHFTNPLLDNIWNLTSVTLAAQLFTLPMTLYYFDQFPNYFVISNFIAVPLSSLILVIELILIAVSISEPVAIITGTVLQYLIILLNSFIDYCNRLPFATWPHLHINLVQSFCLYICFGSLSVLIYWKRKIFVCSALLSFLLFTGIRTRSFINATRQNILIVYSVPNFSAIDLISGRHVYFVGDRHVIRDNRIFGFTIRPNRTQLRANRELISENKNMLVDFGNKKFLLLQGSDYHVLEKSIIGADFIIVSRNAAIDPEKISRSSPECTIIIDRSNSFSYIRRLKEDCMRWGISYFDIAEKGAFVMNLN